LGILKTRLALFALLSAAVMPFQHCGDWQSPAGEYSSVNFSFSSRKISSLSHAMAIYQRLGTKVPVDSPQMLQMQALVESGRLTAAAELAMANDDFYNVAVRDFAAKMSNREESVTNPMNDFIATVIGITRDNLDAREMLTGNYFYYAPNAPVVNKNIEAHLVRSNLHFEELDASHANYAQYLVKNDGQFVIGPGGVMTAMTDPAGVITSRAFLSSHAIAGTNRRLVEFAFSQFLCAPIEEWANTNIPDGFVGRDIGRSPAELYRSKCIGCHAPMDALRPAFAYINFVPSGNAGFPLFRATYTADPRDAQPDVVDVPVPAAEQLVPSKFRRNKSVFTDGHAVATDAWENYTNESFGWRGGRRGNGMNGFGKMLAESRRFSECMARRVFKSVCYKNIPEDQPGLLYDLAQAFEDSKYRLRTLFARAAASPACTGDESL